MIPSVEGLDVKGINLGHKTSMNSIEKPKIIQTVQDRYITTTMNFNNNFKNSHLPKKKPIRAKEAGNGRSFSIGIKSPLMASNVLGDQHADRLSNLKTAVGLSDMISSTDLRLNSMEATITKPKDVFRSLRKSEMPRRKFYDLSGNFSPNHGSVLNQNQIYRVAKLDKNDSASALKSNENSTDR